MNQTKLTRVALLLTLALGCGAALSEAEERCSVANVSARSTAIAVACETRKAAECPKDTYPELTDCPYMQRCLSDLDALQAECEGK